MKKAFTIIELVTVVVILGIIALIIAATTSRTKVPTTPTVNKNFVVLSRESLHDCCNPFIYVVKDSQTEIEYILVQDSSGISITPRLPKKEEK